MASDSAEVRYTVGLKSSKRAARVTTLHDFLSQLIHGYGRVQLYEWFEEATVGKPAFDVDAKLSAGHTAQALLPAALAALDVFFGTRPETVIVASSHGGDKLSFRFFVPGFRMRVGDIKARILRMGLGNRTGGPFDTAIYGATQKLRCVGSIKTAEDARPLILIDPVTGAPIGPTLEMLRDTLVQAADPTWPLLEEPAYVAPRGRQRPPDPGCLEVAPVPKRQRGRPPKAETIPADLLRALIDMGFKEPRFVGTSDEGVIFDARNRDTCPNCGHDHESQHWWAIPKPDEFVVSNYSNRCVTKHYPKEVEAIVPAHSNIEGSLALLQLEDDQADKFRGALHYHETVVKVACYRPECLACERHHDCTSYTATQLIPQHCWSVRNDDNSCRGRIFHHTARLADKMHCLFSTPNEESLIGLFLEGHKGIVHVEHQATFMWATAADGGGRWRKLTAAQFESHISLWLNTLLQGVGALSEFKDYEKQLKLALAKVTPGGVAKMKNLIQGRISLQALSNFGEEATMDGNPFILGAGASVIDLKYADPDTGTFITCLRHAQPEDLVTKSVGYDIPQNGLGDTDAVEAVFAQIYPIQEERRFFQLYGGYCLLGSNPAKGFLCLTDRRKGDNGKSTAVRLLRRALGDDYVIDNKQNLLYEARYSTSVNGHDSGMLAFEGKRLAIMEELSATRTLDTSVMKQLTGGEARISVRAAGAADTRAMAWSAKLVTVFNEGCAPRFKAEDDAFTKRMIVVPHRSFFCKDQAARAAHTGEEHTFDADGTKIEQLEAEPWKLLAWFLEGLEAYWATGKVEFQAPAACREWAGVLVDDQDETVKWVDENVEVSVGCYTTIKDAYANYKRQQGTLGKVKFGKKIKQVMTGRGVSFVEQSSREGVHLERFWDGIRLIG